MHRLLFLFLNIVDMIAVSFPYLHNNNNWQSVTSDYDCILAILIGSSKKGRLEMTSFSVPTASESISIIWRNAMSNTKQP